jgi:hypothetical protein
MGNPRRIGIWPKAYWLTNSVGAVRDAIPPETCEAIRNATMTAGTLINLRN